MPRRGGQQSRLARLLTTLLLMSIVTPLGRVTTAQAEPALRVAVSTPIFADIVRQIGGDRVDVYSVIPINADPHTWEATAADIVAMSESDSFIYMGAYLEPFIESGAWRRAARDAGILELKLADHVSLIEIDRVIDHGDHTHDLRDGDPHVWLDPLRVIEVVTAVTAHLSDLDPDGAATYGSNAAAYSELLRGLDADLESSFVAIPQEARKLIVFHDAYTYFSARYGFEIVGVVLLNPGAEPSAREISDLIETVEETGVGVVFKEPQFDAKVLDAVAAETDVVIGELLTDNFAGQVETYLDLMRFNRDSLVTHLAPNGDEQSD